MAPRDYRLISADGHLLDPPVLWTASAPAKYRDQVPRMERFGGAALVPAVGVDDAVAQVQRLAGVPGIAAYLLKRYPHGDASVVTHYGSGEYAAAEEAYAKVVQVFTRLSSRVAVKAVLRSLGLRGGWRRPPRLLLPEDEDTDAALRALAAVDVPELAPLLGPRAIS